MAKRKMVQSNLMKNSISAYFAAIEIHNKPNISYRYETTALLLMNAWELVLKAFIKKFIKKKSIYTGDGHTIPLDVFEKRLATLKSLGFKAIVGLKPRLNKDIIQRMKIAADAGAVALTIDLDSAGRAARATKGQTVEPKTPAQLKELVKASPLPLLFKGIMTPDEAEIAIKAGAAGIVVSNHGGRTLADTPGTAAVLPRIVDKVKGRCYIMVDGTVARGTDIEKYLALGANCTLAGRHFVRAAHGGLADGVALFADRLQKELAVAMVLTGAQKIKDITRKMVTMPR